MNFDIIELAVANFDRIIGNQLLIWLGCISNCGASLASVISPSIATNAIIAFNVE